MKQAEMGKGHSEPNTSLLQDWCVLKVLQGQGGHLTRLHNVIPVTSPCTICASSDQHVISICLNIPMTKVALDCTFSNCM